MRVRTATVLSLAAACAAAAACADGATAPDDADLAAAAQSGGRTGAQSDTTHPTVYPASVRVRGRVLAGGAPVSGARVTLYRNVLLDGKGVSQRVGERTTGADGAFVFEGAPGGPYVLALNVTPERFYGDAIAYVMGDLAEVSADLRIGTAAAPDSTTR